MFKVPLEELKRKIVASNKITLSELAVKIKEKINEMAGLISEEGAAHIIANELGINLIPQGGDILKIKEIYAGMRNISTLGKVVRKFEVREFPKGDSTGKVCTLILGDETGTIRVVFWNDQIDLLQAVGEQTVLKITDAYARENKGIPEIHLGNAGKVAVDPAGIQIAEVRQGSAFQRKEIKELFHDEANVELLGTVVQVFDPRFFYVHPETGKRLRDGEDAGVVPALSYVMNVILDDGTGTIRCVFWKNQTNHLLSKEEAAMRQYKENLVTFQDVKNDLLGEQFRLMGKVQRNEMFDRTEFNVQLVEKADPHEELRRLEARTMTTTL